MSADRSRRFPEADEEIEELRVRVRQEHAAYMKKWDGWTPGESKRATVENR